MKTIIIFILGAFFTLVLSGCAKMIPHYKIDIEQGNKLDKKLINRIRPGMTKRQVRYILGTPVITDSFHQNRWDYVYTFKKGGKKKLHTKTMSVFFANDRVVRIEGTVKPEFSEKPVKTESARIIDVEPEKKKKKGIIGKTLGKIGLGRKDKKPKPEKKPKKKTESKTDADDEDDF